jgi:hypothetical protein
MSKASRAAYIGFNDSVVPGQSMPLVRLSSPWALFMKSVDTMRSWCKPDTQKGGCNYQKAIDRALEYFSDTGFVHAENKAIIFISGSEPDSGRIFTQAQIDQLRLKRIPVYGVSPGKKIGAALFSLCLLTSGKTYLIAPDSLTVIHKPLKQINKVLVKPLYPRAFSLTNNTNGSKAAAVSFTKLGDTASAVKLDTSVRLLRAINRLSAVSRWISQDSTIDTTTALNFIVNAGGTPPCKSCRWCWQNSKLSVCNGTGNSVDTLKDNDKEYVIRVRYFGPDSQSVNTVMVKVVSGKGDQETFSVSKIAHDGFAAIYEKRVMLSILPQTEPVMCNNGITEASLYIQFINDTYHQQESDD